MATHRFHPTTEWGSKARKAEERFGRSNERRAAIADQSDDR